jgi:hypothetical protein
MMITLSLIRLLVQMSLILQLNIIIKKIILDLLLQSKQKLVL